MPDIIITSRSPHYCLTAKHHGGPSEHGQWNLNQQAELDLFYEAWKFKWVDDRDIFWAILDQAKKLGTNHEIVSKYPSRTNSSDPYHGYPASPKKRNADIPPVNIVDGWVKANRIKRALKMRILKGQV